MEDGFRLMMQFLKRRWDVPHFTRPIECFPLTLSLSLPPSRRASVSATLRRDRAEAGRRRAVAALWRAAKAEGEGGKAPLRRDGGREREQQATDWCLADGRSADCSVGLIARRRTILPLPRGEGRGGEPDADHPKVRSVTCIVLGGSRSTEFRRSKLPCRHVLGLARRPEAHRACFFQ